MSHDITITEHEGIRVVRDDLIPGGTKARVLPQFMQAGCEYVYASPCYGYAQMALAICGEEKGAKVSIFVAARNDMHPYTKTAQDHGAAIHEVSFGRLSNVQSKARQYANQSDATLFPFGLDMQGFSEAIAQEASSIPFIPKEVWCAVGSGTLYRGLRAAWPEAKMCAVRVGANTIIEGAHLVRDASEPFERPSKEPPPFPSAPNYDAKVWQFIQVHASEGALFWNVGA